MLLEACYLNDRIFSRVVDRIIDALVVELNNAMLNFSRSCSPDRAMAVCLDYQHVTFNQIQKVMEEWRARMMAAKR